MPKMVKIGLVVLEEIGTTDELTKIFSGID
jgi:hypothetical protein